MKKKDLIITLIFILIILILSSFFFKKKIDTKKFIEICDRYELKHYDLSKQITDEKVKEATIGESIDLWQIEFYILNSNRDAKEMYKKNLDTYNTFAKGSVSSSKRSFIGYNEFTVVTNYRYYHVCRVKNTLLFVNVPMEYQNDVKEIIKKLGY